jgi:chromosome partitioning protein
VKVIAFVSTKGGVGKSTLSACVSVAAMKAGFSVYLLDLDPQQSTAAWWRRRKGPENPMLATGVESASRGIRAIKTKKAERDFLIVDTPGSFIGVINDAIQEAQCIVIVTQASAKDIEAQGAVEGLILKAGKLPKTLYTINRVNPKSALTKQAADVLSARSTRLPVMICDRLDYVKADAAGKAANEISKAAEAEVSVLWNIMKGIANDE